MEDIVNSVRRVTDIMAEISQASQDQTAGIELVNRAIGQMEGATQQNAALVDQAGNAAAALQQQAENLEQVVSVFKMQQQAAARAPVHRVLALSV
jgi:methyl-accepting chemotaxis protein